MKTRILIALLWVSFCIGCGQKQPPPAAPKPAPAPPPAVAKAPEAVAHPGRFVSVQGQRFVAPDGRQLLLHGMSVISKSPKENYQSWHGAEEFALMREWGMNCVRLGIIWDGLEPEPGKYDEEYLKKVDKRVAWAKDNGIYVFLDMHQDLYSVLYSDGAPEWATLSDNQPHDTPGSVWSDAYFTSPAVQAALDSFWANKPAPDGVGLQDHFAKAWKLVAQRYADEPTVLGYDLFNEPNPGANDLKGQLMAVSKFAEAIAKNDGPGAPTVDVIVQQWMDPQGRSALMKRLADMDIYKALVAGPEQLFKEFERTQLMPMFQKVTNAIREVDKDHLILLETCMSANMGIYTGIEPVLGPDGKRDPQQAYAPHGYDIVVDTADIANASNDRIELIFARHGETAKRLNMPMLVGEWGAYGHAGPEILPTARFVVRQFEKLLCGDTYWLFEPGIQNLAYFEILRRPIPVAVAGALVAYEANPETGVFTCTWKEDPKVTAPSRIYLPKGRFPGKEAVEIVPAGRGFEVQPAREGSQSLYLTIAPTGEAVERTLTVKSAK